MLSWERGLTHKLCFIGEEQSVPISHMLGLSHVRINKVDNHYKEFNFRFSYVFESIMMFFNCFLVFFSGVHIG